MLRQKTSRIILSGYLLTTFLLVAAGVVSTVRLTALTKSITYLTNDVAAEINTADRIRSETLSMRTAIEKFIYMNKQKDRIEAETHISNLYELLRAARTNMFSIERLEKLAVIQKISHEYIDKFNNVVIRIAARDDNVRDLNMLGNRINSQLVGLILNNKKNEKGFIVATNSLTTFQSLVSEINNFMITGAPDLADEILSGLMLIQGNLKTVKTKEFEDMSYEIESYLDSFEGVAAVSIKMNKEIEETLLPLAPKIVSLANEVTASGWDEMKRASKEVRQKTWVTKIMIHSITLLIVIMGFIITSILRKRRNELELLKSIEIEKEANLSKSMFLANMSHEIRTPMNGVIGMTGLLLDTELTEQQRIYAETIRKSGDALLTIINDILDFSKIEAGKLDLEVMNFDLRTTLEDMSDTLAVRAQEKNLEFTCLIEHDVPTLLKGDPGRLRQILLNLSGNAIKFTAEGEVKLHVSLVNASADHMTIRFDVTDTGIGISEEQSNKLFEKFTQADASTTRRFGGTGLGLAISKQLSQMMEGEIGIDSQEGQGSTFWFTAVFEKQRTSDRQPVLKYAKTLIDKNILIVDDNETNRLVLKEQLKSWQCRFDEAEDGESALQKLYRAEESGNHFEIAILDMQMPVMNGAMLGEKIKKDNRIKNTKLVLMTSLGLRGEVSEYEKIGFSAYLVKPVKQSKLYECLLTVLSMDISRKNKPSIVTRHSLSESKKYRFRILIAEDNPTNQMVALGIIEKLGFRADAVANGAEVLKSLKTIPYDLVFMDVQMPEMDGLTATRKIREREKSEKQPGTGTIKKHIPIIAMTANAMKGDRQKCIDAGMDDYIPKPIHPEKVQAALEKYLRDFSGTGPGLKRSNIIEIEQKQKNTKDPVLQDQESNVLNIEVLSKKVSNDKTLVKKILSIYIKQSPEQISQLKEAYKEKNTGSIRALGHSLKGASGNIGAENIQAIALEIENAGKQGDLNRTANLIENLEKEYSKTQKIIKNLI